MKLNQLKSLLKHIMVEAIEAGVQPDAKNNVPERDYNDPRVVAHSIYQPVYLTRFSHKDKDGSDVYEVLLHSASGPRHFIKHLNGKWFYATGQGGEAVRWNPADEYLKASGEHWDAYHKKYAPKNEMIANKNVAPEPMGAVNIEEDLNYQGLVRARELAAKYFGKDRIKDVKLKQHDSKRDISLFEVTLTNDESKYLVRDREHRWYEKVPPEMMGHSDRLIPIDISKLDASIKPDAPEKLSNKLPSAHVAKSWNPDAMLGLAMAPNKKIKENDDDDEDEPRVNFQNGDRVKLKPKWAGREAKEIFTLSQWNGRRGWIGDKDGRGWYAMGSQIMKVDDVDEQSVSGGAGSYSTPFAFKKKVHEGGSFESKVRARIGGAISKAKTLKNEKTLPDGKYADDMLDGGRMKRVEDMNEAMGQIYFDGVPYGSYFKLIGYNNVVFQRIDRKTAKSFEVGRNTSKLNTTTKTKKLVMPPDLLVTPIGDKLKEDTSSGAVFSGGPTIQTPAWGTKNKLGSPKAIKASKGLGLKVVKSITDEE